MSENDQHPLKETNATVGYGEYDAETVERIHQENIKKSRLALEQSSSAEPKDKVSSAKQYTWKTQARVVGNNEISPYQGTGGKKQMLRAQSRKRRQVRRSEASIWDNIAPKEVHGVLNFMLFVIIIFGLTLAFVLAGIV